jgi:RsiW-degrading membrane proteinase PrsW (M82 family)
MQGRDMERTIKIWLSIIFPAFSVCGLVPGDSAAVDHARPGAPWDIVVGVCLAGAFSVLFSRMLARHLDEDDIPEEEPKAATARTAPFAVTVR